MWRSKTVCVFVALSPVFFYLFFLISIIIISPSLSLILGVLSMLVLEGEKLKITFLFL